MKHGFCEVCATIGLPGALCPTHAIKDKQEQAGDICNECEVNGEPGALCQFHANIIMRSRIVSRLMDDPNTLDQIQKRLAALDRISRPTTKESSPLGFDPDDYPL